MASVGSDCHFDWVGMRNDLSGPSGRRATAYTTPRARGCQTSAVAGCRDSAVVSGEMMADVGSSGAKSPNSSANDQERARKRRAADDERPATPNRRRHFCLSDARTPAYPGQGTSADAARARRRNGGSARARAGEGDRRPAARRPRDPDRVPGRRALPAARRARAGEDAPHQEARRGRRPQVQPHPVHAGPDAVRHPRRRGHRGGSDDREARDPVHSRADLRQHHPGRRDQPHAAEDAGGAARGDAGVPGHRERRAVRARSSAVRAGDAESDRTGRHLSAARSAARSVHVQRRHRLSDRGRRAAHPRADDRQHRSGDCGRRVRRRDRAHAQRGPRRAGGGERARLRDADRPGDAPGRGIR